MTIALQSSFRCVSYLSSSSRSSVLGVIHYFDLQTPPSRNLVCQGYHCYNADSTLSMRNFSGRSTMNMEFEGLMAQRNKSIIMHPDGHGQKILPGNLVIKENPKTGVKKKVLLEHALGYFWALKDLSLTDKKPILANEELVPAAEAEKFPRLKNLVNLQKEVVDIPDFFVRNNRSKDANVQCTLVAISCKDFGAQLLPTWIEPFDKALCNGKDADRFEIVRITITEGWITKLLSPFILSGTKKNVPEKDHSNTLLYYGDAEKWRDILRIHNTYTGYVFLVDGIGRVRWAGSGEGSDEEVLSMIKFAKELTQPTGRATPSSKPRIGRRVPH